MGLKPGVSGVLTCIIGGIFTGLIAAGHSCLAQDVEMPSSEAHQSTPRPQAGSSSASQGNFISLRKRGAPARDEGVVLELSGKHIKFLSGGITQGAGLTFRYSKSFAFRIEAGASSERTSIYFSFSRGF